MHETPLLDKPVIYGSEGADWAFIALAVVHAVFGGGAVVSGVVALAARKGRRVHRRVGRWFVGLMVATALSGIALDVVRLSSFFAENHTKYAGSAMPSSIPARLAFLYGALCILYLARVGAHPRVFSRRPAPLAGWERALPWALGVAGVGVTALVIARFNPWTGALWMIATFGAATLATGRMTPGVAQHRFAMLFLVAFSWWGALQGFGPALGRWVVGDDPSTRAYVGHLPGDFSPAFFGFLVSWAPAFVVAALLHRRFRRAATS